MFYSVLSALPFGIDITKILLHLLNFAILVVGLGFLVYKPVLKFIKKRQSDIQESIDKGEQMQADAQSKMEEYQSKLEQADDQARQIKAEKEEEGKTQAQEIIDQAQKEAKSIKEAAREEAEEIKKEALEEAKDQIADAVITIAQDVVGRELSRDDDQRLISQRLKEWKGDDK